jgi:hypothetical protein
MKNILTNTETVRWNIPPMMTNNITYKMIKKHIDCKTGPADSENLSGASGPSLWLGVLVMYVSKSSHKSQAE